MSSDREKQLAAEAAAEFVEDGMLVGLGTGSTVRYLLPVLAARGRGLRGGAASTVPTRWPRPGGWSRAAPPPTHGRRRLPLRQTASSSSSPRTSSWSGWRR